MYKLCWTFSEFPSLQQLIMDSLVGNTVQIMLDGFRIAHFLQQLIMDCLLGNTVQIMLDIFRISQFAAAYYGLSAREYSTNYVGRFQNCPVLVTANCGRSSREYRTNYVGWFQICRVLAAAHHLSLSWASSIQSIPPHPTSGRSTFVHVTFIHGIKVALYNCK